jgi:hypothetical protein
MLPERPAAISGSSMALSDRGLGGRDGEILTALLGPRALKVALFLFLTRNSRT